MAATERILTEEDRISAVMTEVGEFLLNNNENYAQFKAGLDSKIPGGGSIADEIVASLADLASAIDLDTI